YIDGMIAHLPDVECLPVRGVLFQPLGPDEKSEFLLFFRQLTHGLNIHTNGQSVNNPVPPPKYPNHTGLIFTLYINYLLSYTPNTPNNNIAMGHYVACVGV